MTSTLERTFLYYWRIQAPDLPAPEREWRFYPGRKFRFDFAWPRQMVAVEVEGGTWGKGRHVTGKGYAEDCVKYNFAAVEGWCVLRFTSDMLDNDPAACIALVRQALERTVQ